MSEAEGASEASSPEQANELALRANKRTDERVAQYLRLYSCLFQTTVPWFKHDEGSARCCGSFNSKCFVDTSHEGLFIPPFVHRVEILGKKTFPRL